MGILADPRHALDLLTLPDGGTATPGSGTGAINLFVHLTPEDLADHLAGPCRLRTGAVDIERLGAATTGLLDDWCTRHTAAGGKVIVRPVLDLADPRAVDQHDPPAWMREQVVESNAFCVFPGCRRDSRSCDLDHITEYVPLHEGGPPGQTRATNLAPAVSHPSPGQDLHFLDLQTTR